MLRRSTSSACRTAANDRGAPSCLSTCRSPNVSARGPRTLSEQPPRLFLAFECGEVRGCYFVRSGCENLTARGLLIALALLLGWHWIDRRLKNTFAPPRRQVPGTTD